IVHAVLGPFRSRWGQRWRRGWVVWRAVTVIVTGLVGVGQVHVLADGRPGHCPKGKRGLNASTQGTAVATHVTVSGLLGLQALLLFRLITAAFALKHFAKRLHGCSLDRLIKPLDTCTLEGEL
ncbi:unnamed protein product, partial [Meganyctiphanes norvegica]